jgi:hypothetical protein
MTVFYNKAIDNRMERLTKRQKEILTYLSKIFPNFTDNDSLVKELGGKSDDILADIETLRDKELIKTVYGTFHKYICVSISPKGREKLHETFFTRIQDTALKNPWVVATVFVAVVLGIPNLYLQYENI